MSGFSQNTGIGGKNPPWARQANNSTNNSSNNITANVLNTAAISLYQQLAQASLQLQAGFQNNHQFRLPQLQGQNQTTNQNLTNSLQTSTFNPLNPVRYPTQVTTAYTSSGSQLSNLSNATSQSSQGNQSSNSGTTTQKTRVFTGTITRKQENFGFIDDDVFFRSTAVQGREPSVGDTVLVEATYNDAMPFKWNATKVQAISSSRSNNVSKFSDGAFYNSASSSSVSSGRQCESRFRDVRPRDRRSPDRSAMDRRNEDRRFERDRHSRETDTDYKLRDSRRSRYSPEKDKSNRERERDRDRSRNSPSRLRSRSPPRRHAKIPSRYTVQVPRITLDLPELDVLEIRRRYSNMYIPSDFFLGEVRWVDQFPPLNPFALDHPCNFHVMKKEADPVYKNEAVLEPPDLDYLYSAKVMLMSMPNLQDIYRKCITLAEDGEKDDAYEHIVHPSRLLNFLVGMKGKNEAMAIGGPWSPSLDGQNPDKDPSVLIRTAIRTCKALTGVDLSNCTQWYRFVEIHYQRSDTLHKGKHFPARVETVVLFLPDVWSCIPTQLEWEKVKGDYKKFVEKSLDPEKSADADSNAELESEVKSSLSTPKTPDEEKETDKSVDENPCTPSEKSEPSHYSQLDPKNMKVQHLKDELEARNLSSKGLKSQLTARLAKALKAEEDEAKKKEEEEEKIANSMKEEEKKKDSDSWTVVDSWSSVDEKSTAKTDKDEEKKEKEKQKASLEKKYALPDSPHIIIYPSRTAKSGKFECSLMSLSLLLDYRPNDNKEHLFEISLFAELFNEMLMRDFGFLIYRALLKAVDKLKEDERKEDDKKKTDEKKIDEKEIDEKTSDEKKSDDKKSDEKKSDDKKSDDKKSDEKKSNEKKSDEKKNDERKNDDKKSDEKKSNLEESDKKDKKQDKVKYYTENKKLLLAFSYFDTTHCGYILDRDLENLLFSLGLHFSRAQVKKLLGKVIKRDSLTYRKLTDKPLGDKTDEIAASKNEDSSIEAEISSQISAGKKRKASAVSSSSKKVPKMDTCDDDESNFINYKGSLINMESITSQLKRSENARIETESAFTKLKADYSNIEKKLADSNEKVKTLQDESEQFIEQMTAIKAKCQSLSNEKEELSAAVYQVNNIIKPFVLPSEEKCLNSPEAEIKMNVQKIKVEGEGINMNTM